MKIGFTIWFTGLSGAGKSTLANALIPELRARGHQVELLDGDEVRTNLSKGLGFSKEDRDTNIKRIGYVADLLSRNGVIAITAAISPYREVRESVRALISQHAGFVEVYAAAPLTVCEKRDPKGLYRKARAGVLKQFTGVSDPYEAPSHPEVVVHTDRETVEQSVARILARLEELGYVARQETVTHRVPFRPAEVSTARSLAQPALG
jgi:adenylyl-sulfate kinase